MIPYGNYSYVKVLSDDKVLPLYGSGGFRMIFDTKVREQQGDNSGWLKPPTDLDIGCSAILPGQ